LGPWFSPSSQDEFLPGDIEIVGRAADGEAAVRTAKKLKPDVILMDISMLKMDGIDATRIIYSEFPK